MSNTNELSSQAALTISRLLTQYLQQQTEAHAQGLGLAEPTGDAFPHDPGTLQPVDPQLAWKEVCLAAELFELKLPQKLPVVPDWSALLGRLESQYAVPLAFGAFPQQVRQLEPLLSGDWASLRPGPGQPLNAPEVVDWAERLPAGPAQLLGAGILRLLGQFEASERLLAGDSSLNDAPLTNERAALAWQRGQTDLALELWRQLPDSTVANFNRGMACLFLGDRHSAADQLRRAIAGLPANGGWHHLAALYLALAQG